MKLSIITINYNNAEGLERTLNSVLAQTYDKIEHIIVDGGSKDHTLYIIEAFKDDYLRVISEPDKGLYDAINKGIKMATGDVVGIINSDDFFHRDDIFKVIAKAFEEENASIITMEEHDESLEAFYLELLGESEDA